MPPHWTPYYVFSRIKRLVSELRFPTNPWMPASAIDALEQLMRPSDRAVEFGSGRSTLWLALRTAHVTSVEEDARWADVVRSNTRELSNVSLHLKSGDDYVELLGEFDDRSIDVCLIDGALRDRCAILAVAKIATGGLIVVDDAHRYLPHTSTARLPGAAKQPTTPAWAEFWREIEGWRSLWYDDGVTATAIFIRA